MNEHFIKEVIDTIAKSEEDNRQYKGFVLTNGLKVVLISDPETDISSASLEVNVGSMYEPKDIPGLAHFLEHMLFLGTKEYPIENDYIQYISRNGGHRNAFTSNTHTNFIFDVSTDHLSGALHRFAQFFIDPLLTESATEREMNAVDSEYQMDRDMDVWRLHVLDCSLMNPDHAYTRFSIGNIETLKDKPLKEGIDVRKALLEFHDKWFSANIMSLAVLGKESIEELTKMTVPLFSSIKNKNVITREWTDHPLTKAYLGKEITVVPIMDFRSLKIQFPIPDLHEHYKSKPASYLSHLIGHEGPGSLLSELKARGLCTALGAGSHTGAKGFGFFTIGVTLTVDGIDKTEEIITLVFQYINLLKKEGPQQWIFDQRKSIWDIDFRFMERENPFNFTRKLASRLNDYPMGEILTGPELLHEFRPDLISQVLELLNPDNMRFTVIGKKFEGVTESEEKWFGVKYKMSDIDHGHIDKWKNCGLNERLSLPPVNQFIPSDLSLKERDGKEYVPDLIKNTKLSRVWHLQDTKYIRPLANYTFKLTIPGLYDDPVSHVKSHLIIRNLNDGLNEYCYAPGLAGLHFQIFKFENELEMRFCGYSDKLTQFMASILDRIINFKIDPKRFEILKEEYYRMVKTYQSYDLTSLLLRYSSWILSERYWSFEEVIETETEITLESVQQFMARLWSRFHIEALIHGNIRRDEALKVCQLFESHFRTTKTIQLSEHWRNRELQLTEGSNLYFETTNSVHQTNAIRVYIPIGVEETDSDNCLAEMFVQLIKEQFFTELRTKQQLGYVTQVWFKRSRGVQGLIFIIQSDYSPEYLDERIEAFLSWIKEYLTSMSDEVFESERQALITRIQESPKKMFHYSNKLWEEIDQKVYHWNRDRIEVKVIKGITKEDVVKFYQKYISHESPNRKKLSVRISNEKKSFKVLDKEKVTDLYPAPKLKNCKRIEDVLRLKERSALYRLPEPFIYVNNIEINE